MTTTKPVETADTVDPPRRRTKSVLFCPNCGHESPLTGDWLCDSDNGACRCPECRSVISMQRADD